MNIRVIGVNVSYFYKEPLLDSVKRLAKIGFRRMEFAGLSLMQLSVYKFKELTKILKEEGIICTSINTISDLVPVNLGNLAALNDKERNNAIYYLRQCFDFADALQSKRVICDTGTTTEDFVSPDTQDEILISSISEIIKHTKGSKMKVVLMNVPGRRWVAWDGLPPDRAKVVERHVWPWRMWIDKEKILKTIGIKLKEQVFWAFDTANELVANGVTKFRLGDMLTPYLEYSLEIVYLSNHPGPYNKVWHRSLIHQPLWNGFYTTREYISLLNILSKKRFSGEIVLQIREKEPSEYSLKRSIKVLEGSLR